MSDNNDKKENFAEALLNFMSRDKDSQQFLLESIVTISTEMQALITAVDALTVAVNYHNEAIEDLYKAQDIIIKILKVKQGDSQDLPVITQKNKQNLN